MESDHEQAQLTFLNVALAFVFILFNVVISYVFDLGVGLSLLVAAARCVGQLAVVGFALQRVFEWESGWGVAGIAFLLNLLGTFETVVNKSKKRHQNMFPSVLFSMLASTIPISIIGVRWAMSVERFWTPSEYIPVVGMLCGSTINGVVVTTTYVLKELQENRDRVEMYLSFGASRVEACKPIAVDALRIALTPVINQMSVLGIIAIPGMMTGAILGGSSVHQAAKLQMVIMFMISASTALASICATTYAVNVVVDKQHRVRPDRIYAKPLFTWGGGEGVSMKIKLALISFWNGSRSAVGTICQGISKRVRSVTPYPLGRERSESRTPWEERAGLLERGLSYEES